MNTAAGLKLSPLEKLCLQFNQLVRQFYEAPRYSKQGIVILRKIHEVRARLADELPPVQSAPTPLSTAASAENEKEKEGQPQLVRKPFLSAISWRGITVEARFLWDALSHDLGVAIPFGSFLPFDVMVMTAANNYRVRVKYTTCARFAGGVINLCRHDGSGYRNGDFDILAALTSEGNWYIVPFEAIKGRKTIRLLHRQPMTRKDSGTPIEKYRDRWDLFK